MNSMQKSMKKTICFLADFLNVGGCETVLGDVVSLLVEDYDITVTTLYGISEEMLSLLGPNVTVHSNTINRSFNQIDFFFLSMPIIGPQMFKRYIPGKYDYLILLRSGYLMAAYSKKADKVICWTHTDKDIMYANPKNLNFMRRINKLRLQMGYRKLDATWVVADHIKEQLSHAFGLSNVYTLDNPIDAKKIMEKANENVPFMFAPDYFHFIMLGRLSPEKGHIRALRAFRKLSAEHRCKMVIVGDGWIRNSLEQYVQENHLADRVIFVGHQSNPYPYIKQADAMVLPSEYESFGVVLLESMILKTPVMTTATTGGIRVTESGKYGVLVDNSDEGIEQGMRQCLNHTEAAYVDRAWEWALTFDKSALRARLDELLKG